MDLFEVGVVYRRGSQLFLAIDQDQLMTFKDGKPVYLSPKTSYEMVRVVSVNQLCEHWGIDSETLDAETSKRLAPAQDNIKTQPRGSRRLKVEDAQLWEELRTVRVSKCRD